MSTWGTRKKVSFLKRYANWTALEKIHRGKGKLYLRNTDAISALGRSQSRGTENAWIWNVKWTAQSENMPLSMHKMWGLTSPCICAKYHPGLFSSFQHYVVSSDSVSEQWRLWSDCADNFAVRIYTKIRFRMAQPYYLLKSCIPWPNTTQFVSFVGVVHMYHMDMSSEYR